MNKKIFVVLVVIILVALFDIYNVRAAEDKDFVYTVYTVHEVTIGYTDTLRQFAINANRPNGVRLTDVIDMICQMNNISEPDRIQKGQVIKVPVWRRVCLDMPAAGAGLY